MEIIIETTLNSTICWTTVACDGDTCNCHALGFKGECDADSCGCDALNCAQF